MAATTAAFVLLVVPSAIADPPVIFLPSNQTLEAESSAGASLTWYPPPVTDENPYNLQCDYTSNTFPFGSTTVHCAAQDTVTLDPLGSTS